MGGLDLQISACKQVQLLGQRDFFGRSETLKPRHLNSRLTHMVSRSRSRSRLETVIEHTISRRRWPSHLLRRLIIANQSMMRFQLMCELTFEVCSCSIEGLIVGDSGVYMNVYQTCMIFFVWDDGMTHENRGHAALMKDAMLDFDIQNRLHLSRPPISSSSDPQLLPLTLNVSHTPCFLRFLVCLLRI